MKKLLTGLCLATALTSLQPAGAAEQVRDEFYWLGQINKASDVINTDEGLLTQEQGQRFAKTIDKVIRDGNKPGAARPKSVITFEPLLIKDAGQEITMIHAGRSSQDMLTSINYIMLRENMLELADELNKLQATLLATADANRETIVPNYTNGVAAQPNSYGHYLLAFANAFDRDMQRLREYYVRLNRSPMGTTVLNGTGWPLNRDRMADYLGFDGLAYNAFDASQVYSFENPIEAAAVCSTIAIHIGNFIADVMQQYAQPHPWILLEESSTYVSSAMPQKRNPGVLNTARRDASEILGAAAAASFRSHNIPPGMFDPRSTSTHAMVRKTAKLVRDFNKVLNALVIDPERSLAELNLDWTCSQEIADVLMRKYRIPFRTGHHFASEIVTYARANNVTPKTITYAAAQEIYARLAKEDKHIPAELPMSEADFKAALDPVAIVHNRATKGGPQPAEMTVMLDAAKEALTANEYWLHKCRDKQQKAEAKLNNDFEKLLK